MFEDEIPEEVAEAADSVEDVYVIPVIASGPEAQTGSAKGRGGEGKSKGKGKSSKSKIGTETNFDRQLVLVRDSRDTGCSGNLKVHQFGDGNVVRSSYEVSFKAHVKVKNFQSPCRSSPVEPLSWLPVQHWRLGRSSKTMKSWILSGFALRDQKQHYVIDLLEPYVVEDKKGDKMRKETLDLSMTITILKTTF